MRKSKGKSAHASVVDSKASNKESFRTQDKAHIRRPIPPNNIQATNAKMPKTHQDGATMPSRKVKWRSPGNLWCQQNSSACRWTSSSVQTSSQIEQWWIVAEEAVAPLAINPHSILWTEPAPWIVRMCSLCERLACRVCRLQVDSTAPCQRSVAASSCSC